MIRRSQPIQQRGVAAVEFGLVLVVLLLIVAGIVELGRAFWYYDALTKATRDGARLLSIVDRATFSTGTHIADARSRVVANSNAANLNPPLTLGQVQVTCLDASFTSMNCASGANAPANVRIAISGYRINIGGMIPFLPPTGGGATTFPSIALAPQTTMPFMN
jgi:Flp pilus assembly protein TadG